MITRRRVMQTGMALCTTGAAAPAALAAPALAQTKSPVKVRYVEVIRSILYVPAYVAIAKGIFHQFGIDAELTTANGGDKAMPALLAGRADIGLMGPDIPIYVLKSESPVKARIFCGLTATDGFMLLGRKPVEDFDWNSLKGKQILGFRTGSTPLLFFEAALTKKGIDPIKDVTLHNNVGFAAREGSWISGQNDYAIFMEPDASQLEKDKKAFFLASIGDTVGPADYTAFMATDNYIRDNPEIIQGWTNAIYAAMRWTAAASIKEIADTVGDYFLGIDRDVLEAALERYRRLKIWKTSPKIDPAAIERFQDILVAGHVLDPAKRVSYQSLVMAKFAADAR